METESRVHRGVVSFVRRSTRMNDAQTKAWARYKDRFVVDVERGELWTSLAPGARVDWDAAFGRQAPRVVEIGSGAGDSLVPMAAARPEVDFIAFEVFEPAVASTLGRLAREGVSNVRIVVADGAQGLAELFPTSSVAELWTFFADPWHKTRHHKRRLVNPDFADVAADKLIEVGLWRLATDWEDYAHWQRETLEVHPRFENAFDGWAPRLEARPVTKYEARGLAAGRAVHDLCFRRVP